MPSSTSMCARWLWIWRQTRRCRSLRRRPSSTLLIRPEGDFTQSEERIARCMKSEDYIEGRRAFMEKRAPRFQGK